MLKKKYRLPSSIRLEKAITKSFKYFVLKTAASALPYPRFAFVISKKVDARAVFRNKIKREMTGAVAGMIDRIIEGKDLLFILKRDAANADNLSEALREAFKQQNLLK